MSALGDYNIFCLPCRNDNYAFILSCSKTKTAYVIDTPDGKRIHEYCDSKGLTIIGILNTHHHGDHTGGNIYLKNIYNCKIYGSKKDYHRITGITDFLLPKDRISLFNNELLVDVLELDGHTIGHIGYYIEELSSLFIGDTIFNMGCGRLFEGTAKQMWYSIQKVKLLPKDTLLYAAHEYTLDNAKFVEYYCPEIRNLDTYISTMEEIRRKGEYTIPTTIGDQILYNPFLQCDTDYIKKVTNTQGKDDETTFKILRIMKDKVPY